MRSLLHKLYNVTLNEIIFHEKTCLFISRNHKITEIIKRKKCNFKLIYF